MKYSFVLLFLTTLISIGTALDCFVLSSQPDELTEYTEISLDMLNGDFYGPAFLQQYNKNKGISFIAPIEDPACNVILFNPSTDKEECIKYTNGDYLSIYGQDNSACPEAIESLVRIGDDSGNTALTANDIKSWKYAACPGTIGQVVSEFAILYNSISPSCPPPPVTPPTTPDVCCEFFNTAGLNFFFCQPVTPGALLCSPPHGFESRSTPVDDCSKCKQP